MLRCLLSLCGVLVELNPDIRLIGGLLVYFVVSDHWVGVLGLGEMLLVFLGLGDIWDLDL